MRKIVLLLVFAVFAVGLDGGGSLSRFRLKSRRPEGMEKKSVSVAKNYFVGFFEESGKLRGGLFPSFPKDFLASKKLESLEYDFAESAFDFYQDIDNSKEIEKKIFSLLTILLNRIRKFKEIIGGRNIFYLNSKSKELNAELIRKACILAMKFAEEAGYHKDSVYLKAREKNQLILSMKKLVGCVGELGLATKASEIGFENFSLGVW